jgi:hypothetical protein
LAIVVGHVLPFGFLRAKSEAQVQEREADSQPSGRYFQQLCATGSGAAHRVKGLSGGEVIWITIVSI